MDELTPTREGRLLAGSRHIHWEYFGEGRREPLCLLNGLAMHTKAWYPLLPRVLGAHDVVLFDYPGQGESSADDAPCEIPEFCHYLTRIIDGLGIARLHLMGISYGGFVALEYGRLYQDRLHTLTLSGILLSHETLFEMYEDLSLRFYRAGPEAFDLYTHYMYEKIFGEVFVTAVGRDRLETMRQRFHDRFRGQIHSLVRLTEAQDPFFAALDANLPGYRAIATPTLVMAGAEDRAIPPWVQRKICDVLPKTRFMTIDGSGHVVYLEKPDVFWGTLLKFAAARSLSFDA
jgi:pimeloyl-ACP methyl ester carboxylesterase